MCVFSVVSSSASPWTVTCQVPLSMGFSRQEHWSGLLFTPSGDLPHPGIESVSPALAGELAPFTFHNLLFSCAVVSDYLRSHGLQHTRLPFTISWSVLNSCALNLWCHPTISLSVILPPACSLSQRQSLFQWIGYSHQVLKILKLQLQHK